MPAIRPHIGLSGAVHPHMPGDDSALYAAMIGKITKLSGSMGFDLSVFREPLRTEEDGRKACAFMDEKRVDFTLLCNASLPFGRVILPLARARSRLGLWAVPEPTTNGVLQLNSFCGANMLGSIVGNYLNQYDIPFKWFYGLPDSGLFIERFTVTVRALTAIKALRQSRIAQIGGLANGFEGMYIDERILEKKFGTYLQTRYTVEEIVEKARRYSDRDAAAEAEAFRSEATRGSSAVPRVQMEKSARVYLALRDFARENNYDALAVNCWSRFQEIYGIAVCAAMSRLNERGIVTPCEGDVPSAVMMIALNALNGSRAALSDLVAFDETDGSLNLWHCGVAPSCWANEAGVAWDPHFNIGRYSGERWDGAGAVADMRFRQGVVTVASVNNNFDNLFILTGEVMDKESYSGSSGWVNATRLNGTPVGIREIMNTIMVRHLPHHYPMAFGDLTSELNELAAWLSLRVLDIAPYHPWLQRAGW